jgi:hypothetical protein
MGQWKNSENRAQTGRAAAESKQHRHLLEEGRQQNFVSVVRLAEELSVLNLDITQSRTRPSGGRVAYTDKQTFVDEVKREYATIKGRNIWAKSILNMVSGGSLAEHAEISAENGVGRCIAQNRDNALELCCWADEAAHEKR